MAIDVTTIGVGMETSGLVKGQAELAKTEQAANRTADSADKLTGKFSATNAASEALASATKMLAGAFALVKLADLARDAAMLAARYETVGVVMRIAGNNAGYTMAQMEGLSKQLQQSGISMLQSRNSLTQLATANIDLANAAKLGRAAQDLAVVGNINSSEALERLIHGIKSGEVEVLRTIGLNVSFEGSYKKLAAQLGVNSDSLTEQQKTMARTNAVIEESARYNGIYEESMTTAGKAISSLTRYWEDLKVKAGEAFLPALATSVFDLTDALKAANAELEKAGRGGLVADVGGALNGVLKVALQTVAVLAANVAFVFNGLGREIGGIAAQAAAVARLDFSGAAFIGKEITADATAARSALDAFENRMMSVGETTKAVAKMTEAERIAAGQASKAAGEAAEKQAAQTKALHDYIKQYGTESQKAALATKEWKAKLGDLFTPEMEKNITGHIVKTKEAAAAQKAAAAQYDSLMLSIKERIAVAQEELILGRKLTDSDKQAIKLNELLESSKSKLNATQRAALITKSEEARIDEARVKFMVENAAAHERMREALLAEVAVSEKAAATLTDQNKTLRDEIELIGLSEAAQHAITQARGEAIILIKEQELATITAADNELETMSRRQIALAAEIEQLRERNQLTGAKFDKTTVAKAADDANKEWSKFTDDIEKGLTDSLYRGFEAGKGFFKSFWDGIKNLFKTTVLKLAVQGVMTGVTGTASGLANAAGGGGGIGGLLGNVGGLFGGGSAGGIMDLLGSTGMGALDFGGISLSGLSSGAGMLAKAIPYVGWAVAAVTAITALVKKFDTSGTPHVGQLAEYSAAGGLKTSQKHGDFGMGFGGVDYNEGAATLVQGISKTIVGILDSTAKAFGQAAGYSVATGFADDSSKDGAWGGLLIKQMENVLVNWNDSRSSKWAPKVFSDGEEGQKQYLAALSKDVLGALKDMDLPGWAQDTLDALGDAPALDALAKAVDQINVTKAALTQMGDALTGFAGMSDDAITALIKASGGIAGLATNASTYYDNFYSEAEKQAVASKQVSDAMGKLNLEMPTSRDEYRKLVEQYTAMGSEGSATLAALLALSGAFAAITPAADQAAAAVGETLDKALARLRNPVRTVDDVAGNIIGLEDKVFEAENAGNVAALRERELKGLTDTEIALVRRLHALEDEAEAIAKATAIASERKDLERQLLEMQGDTAALRALDRAALDESNRALYDRINAIKDEAEAAAKAATIANERTGLENQLLALLGETGELRARERAALDESNRAIYDQIKAEEDRQAVISKATAIANERTGLEQQLLTLLGETEELRRRERAALDESNRAIYDQINAEKDRQTAIAAAAAVANERAGIERDILALNGDTAAIRALELAGLDAANRALKEHYYALLDEASAATAAAAAATAAANEHAGLQERLWQIQGNTDALRKAALAKLLDDESRRMQQEIWMAEDVAAAQARAQQAAQQAASYAQQAADQQEAAAKQIKDAWQGVSDSLVDEIKRIRGEMVGSGQVGYAQSQAQFAIALAQANAGDQDAMKSLPALSKAMLDLAQANAGSMVELRAIQAATAASLEAANGRIVGQYGLTVPSLDVGTNNVPHDMLLMAHAGEAIVPRAYNPALGGGGSSWNTARLEVLVEMLTAEVIELKDSAKETERQVRKTGQTTEDWSRNGVPVVNQDNTKIATTV